MNSVALARSAYKTSTSIAQSDRSAEYRAFAQITSQLSGASDAGDGAQFAKLGEAILMNRRLWSLLAQDAASDKNGLPQAVRAQILSLANFTWSHSRKVLQKEASADVLIEINTAMMRGLRSVATED